jgi:peptidoglycan hydrolase CwlO-like protein
LNKKTLSLLVAVGLVFSVSSSVLAEPTQQDLQTQQSQLQKDNNALKQVQDKRQNLSSQIEMLDSKIEAAMRQLNDTKKKIDSTQKDIKQAEKDVTQAESDIKEEQQLFNNRVRAMYINGTSSYLSAVLESKGLSDLISRVEAIRKISELDKKVIKELRDKQDAINEKKEKLKTENDNLVALKAENEKTVADLNDKKKEQDKLVADLRTQERLLASKADESQAIVDATMKEIKRIKDAATKASLSRGAVNPTNDKIIAYASNFLGTPYVWGGTTPAGFDCSGFVQYVYRYFGINLGRTTYDQVDEGVAVSRSELQIGDLVFFGNASSPHHVGIYVGNNSYIHAPQTGDSIKVSALTRSDFCAARRVK